LKFAEPAVLESSTVSEVFDAVGRVTGRLWTADKLINVSVLGWANRG
jgi:hypothetical protein